MQFLTSSTLLYIRILFLLVLSFYCLKDPNMLLNSNFSLILGQAMRLPIVQMKSKNPLVGILSIAFASNALADLLPLLSKNIAYFETLVPIRLFIFFGLTSYAYLGNVDYVCNNIVFVYSFFEVWFNFLIYNNLRDEKYYRLKKLVADNEGRLEDDRVRVAEVD